MFLVLAKIFWIVAQPLSVAIILIVAGLLLLSVGRRRSGTTAAIFGVLVLGLASFTTLGALLIMPLENRFQRPEWPETVGAIVMLGGASDGSISAARQVAELNPAGDRFTETLRLAQLYPEARIVVTGGVGLLVSGGEAEAETAKRFFTDMGITQDRLVLESEARNTEENAQLTKAMLAGIEGPVVLVTSAFHMPRSMGLFRKAGMTVLPWPTDYRSSGREMPGLEFSRPVDNLMTASTAIREWIGLVAYRVTGKIDEVFPGP